VEIGQHGPLPADIPVVTQDRDVSRRLPWLAATVVVAVSAALLPFSHRGLGHAASFVPAMVSVIACFDLLSVYLLVGDYMDRGNRRLLVMAWAYAGSLVIMAGYALAFPGAVSTHPLLAATASTAPYLYIAWHGGFPVFLALAWAPWPSRWTAPTSPSRRAGTATATVLASVLTGALVVTVVVRCAHRLPPLIHGLDTSAMTRLSAPVVMPLVAIALVVGWRGTHGRTGPERWTGIAILACLCDLTLTYYASARFSLGWYAGRTMTMLAAGTVLFAMLAAFRRLKAQAEHDASTDGLTGLFNRRTAHQALEQMIALSHRSGAPLAVLSLDLDHFKLVNDDHGHEVGDAVLAETGRLLSRTFRRGDVVSRVGGEEFLVLLPDTDEAGALVVAEKLRAAVVLMSVPDLSRPMTASVGVTVLRPQEQSAEVLRRVDAALYAAKHAGRNRVVADTGHDVAIAG
jgi:diguanylate cyclase (GGDEF)-like protein